MAVPITASHFPSFSEFDPLNPLFTCIYPLKKENYRRCRQSINKDDRKKASNLKYAITNIESAVERKVKLRVLVTLCCCKASRHRHRLEDTDLVDDIVDKLSEQFSSLSRPNILEVKLESNRSLARRRPLNIPPKSEEEEKDDQPIETLPRLRPRPVDSTNPVSGCERQRNRLPKHKFERYKVGTKHSVFSKIQEPVSKTKSLVTGTLYMFTRDSDPGYVKIGYSVDVSKRMLSIEKQCGYRPSIRHSIPGVPHVYRAEWLVHLELNNFWRREKGCVCSSEHQEWFEIDIAKGKEVMNHWTKWLKEARPYDEDHNLKPKWTGICQKIMDTKRELCSQDLIDIMEKEEKEKQERSQQQLPMSDSNAPPSPLCTTPVPSELVPAINELLLLSLGQRKTIMALLASMQINLELPDPPSGEPRTSVTSLQEVRLSRRRIPAIAGF